LELTAEQRDTPLLLFDAAEIPANLGWFFALPVLRGRQKRRSHADADLGGQ